MKLKEINITISNFTETNIIIDCTNNTININGNIKNITEEKIYDLLRIIRDWEPKYYRPSIDKEKYKIELINTNNQKETLIGEGDYPYNYSSLKEWIRGL